MTKTFWNLYTPDLSDIDYLKSFPSTKLDFKCIQAEFKDLGHGNCVCVKPAHVAIHTYNENMDPFMFMKFAGRIERLSVMEFSIDKHERLLF